MPVFTEDRRFARGAKEAIFLLLLWMWVSDHLLRDNPHYGLHTWDSFGFRPEEAAWMKVEMSLENTQKCIHLLFKRLRLPWLGLLRTYTKRPLWECFSLGWMLWSVFLKQGCNHQFVFGFSLFSVCTQLFVMVKGLICSYSEHSEYFLL